MVCVWGTVSLPGPPVLSGETHVAKWYEKAEEFNWAIKTVALDVKISRKQKENAADIKPTKVGCGPY